MKQIKRRKKKWSKIWLLNWVTIITFYTCLLVVLFDNNKTFDLVDLHTWRPEHIVAAITGLFLLLEQIALLRTKNIDVVKSAEDVLDLKEESTAKKKNKKKSNKK